MPNYLMTVTTSLKDIAQLSGVPNEIQTASDEVSKGMEEYQEVEKRCLDFADSVISLIKSIEGETNENLVMDVITMLQEEFTRVISFTTEHIQSFQTKQSQLNLRISEYTSEVNILKANLAAIEGRLTSLRNELEKIISDMNWYKHYFGPIGQAFAEFKNLITRQKTIEQEIYDANQTHWQVNQQYQTMWQNEQRLQALISKCDVASHTFDMIRNSLSIIAGDLQQVQESLLRSREISTVFLKAATSNAIDLKTFLLSKNL